MLKVRVHKLGEVAVLHLQGRIVNGQSHVLRKAISSLFDKSVVVLDFARVSGIDAHGLGVLLDLRQQLQAKGVEFRMINVTKLVRQVLAITKLDTVFEFTTQTETAAAAAASSDQTREVGELAMAPGE